MTTSKPYVEKGFNQWSRNYPGPLHRSWKGTGDGSLYRTILGQQWAARYNSSSDYRLLQMTNLLLDLAVFEKLIVFRS